MDRNPWKLATIGLALVGTTALGTGLATSHLMRTPAPAEADEIAAPSRADAAPRPLPAYHPVTRPVMAPAAASPVPVAVRPVATSATAPADCDTGGERAMRIAKPGLIGGLLGAGLGAAGGAIADGGKAAGKGALIGGIAGAAIGGGYGAYKTRNDCGTIFGDTLGNALAGATSAGASQLAPGAEGGQGITVYTAR
ncbi:MAG TPA: hypothetical protein VF136_19445 [Methylomirabilota bacterium]